MQAGRQGGNKIDGGGRGDAASFSEANKQTKQARHGVTENFQHFLYSLDCLEGCLIGNNR